MDPLPELPFGAIGQKAGLLRGASCGAPDGATDSFREPRFGAIVSVNSELIVGDLAFG
jgi:hypothetical protein